MWGTVAPPLAFSNFASANGPTTFQTGSDPSLTRCAALALVVLTRRRDRLRKPMTPNNVGIGTLPKRSAGFEVSFAAAILSRRIPTLTRRASGREPARDDDVRRRRLVSSNVHAPGLLVIHEAAGACRTSIMRPQSLNRTSQSAFRGCRDLTCRLPTCCPGPRPRRPGCARRRRRCLRRMCPFAPPAPLR